MKILVTGGCGYVGSVLVQRLARRGHEVTVYDAMWFGNHLGSDLNVEVVEGDVRNPDSIPIAGQDAVIHLANVANDPGVELDPSLSWEVNVLATQQLVERAVSHGLRQFIYASSGSVYGLKDEAEVTEDLTLVPISTYNKTKLVAERVVLSYSTDIATHLIRPATVCGLSPRMRFDVSVNMFVKQGVLDGKMTVLGGAQVRPNIHIQDLVAVYEHFLTHPELPSGAYNAGFENLAISEIAELVSSRTGAQIEFLPSNDPRSYRQSSKKLMATGFHPKHDVTTAISEISEALASGTLVDSPEWYTVSWMKQNVLRK